MLGVVVGLVAVGPSFAAASTTPRWVKHVRNYPGGISNGVRAYLDPATSSAKPGLFPTGSSSSSSPAAPPALQNLKMNSQDAKGAAYFDNAAGRLVETTLKQDMDMEVSAMGQNIGQKIKQTITMKLLDSKK